MYNFEVKGTKTEKNLAEAFAGESQARNKYTYFASVAKKAGYEQVADFLLETADNEKEHAKIWFKVLNGGEMPSIEECLLQAAKGENYEHTNMYKKFAEDARAEGFKELAVLFEEVGKIEAEHEARFKALLENIKKKKCFVKKEAVVWVCRNCGHKHVGKKAPEVCPVCNHPQAYFEVENKNY